MNRQVYNFSNKSTTSLPLWVIVFEVKKIVKQFFNSYVMRLSFFDQRGKRGTENVLISVTSFNNAPKARLKGIIRHFSFPPSGPSKKLIHMGSTNCNYQLAPCYLNSAKVFILLSNQYHNPEWGFKPGTKACHISVDRYYTAPSRLRPLSHHDQFI